MKTFLFCMAAAVALTLSGCNSTPDKVANYDIIPAPSDVTLHTEQPPFVFSSETSIVYVGDDADMQRNARFLGDYLNLSKIGQDETVKNSIVLKLGLQSDNSEAYRLEVNSDHIIIQGASAAGVFYGIQTLRKTINPALEAECIPAAVIDDAPRFSYRGAHFDPCRHFFTVEETKQYLDMMALHNMNRFHWHLSEDQGWRIEIKKYPKLTQEGAYRPGTAIGRVNSSNVGPDSQYDDVPVSGFYTQEEAREIVQYAAERYITVIPEIDLPGHMVAALTAYPELGCTGGPYEVWRYWGVSEDLLCIGKDETMQFLKDVLDEICQIFPSEYIHIGGDEAPKMRWERCPRCQAKIRQLGLKSEPGRSKEEKLQNYVTTEMETFLAERGRKIIGWDEILEGGLSPNATVMSWRGEEGGIEAAKLDHDVIMTPSTYLYFDYYHTFDRDNEPLSIGGRLPLKVIYNYEPLPKSLTPEQQKHIFGVQGNLWTEYIPTFSHAQYMALPRWAALSEIQWSRAEKKNWYSFFYRLPKIFGQYEALGFNYARHAYGVNTEFSVDEEAKTINVKLYTCDRAPIHYTTDGTEPTIDSPLFEEEFSVPDSTTLRAFVDRPSNPFREYNRTLQVEKLNARPW